MKVTFKSRNFNILAFRDAFATRIITWRIPGVLANHIEDIIFFNQSGAKTKCITQPFPRCQWLLVFPVLATPTVTFSRAYTWLCLWLRFLIGLFWLCFLSKLLEEKERNGANQKRKTYQLPRENLLVEVELNLFVGDVYTQLFKRIPFKIFKTKYVQDSNSVIIITGKENNGKCVVQHRWISTRQKQKTNLDILIFGEFLD